MWNKSKRVCKKLIFVNRSSLVFEVTQTSLVGNISQFNY